MSFLDTERVYGDAEITRPYMDLQDKSPSIKIFETFKSIFSEKKIIIIEGEYTRFGVGNDLLKRALSVQRILVPPINAFSAYNQILSQALMTDSDSLYLLAIGPTAKILAYDLYKTGRRVFDVGHLDIEYEWYLQQANQKVNIPGKYVNESKKGKLVESLRIDKNKEYLSQIICKISA